jgi:hypothetical protein
VVLEDSYHMVTLDKQRQVVVDKARMFVESIVETRTSTGLLPSCIVKRTARIIRSAIAGRAIGMSGIGVSPRDVRDPRKQTDTTKRLTITLL